MKKSLIACSTLFALNKDIQKGFKLAKVGEWKGHRDGSFKLELKDLEEIKKNFDDSQIDAVIDLDHATLFYGTGEAYGWIKELEIKEDSIFVNKVEWLEQGKELLESKKYKYISPVLEPNTIDPVTGNNIGWTLHSAAITNRPFLEDLGEVIANNKSNKGDKSMEKTAEELEAENKKLQEENEKLQNEKIEQKVDVAIAANKIRPEQKETLIAMGKADPTNFEKFLDEAKPLVQQPQNNIYANNKGGGQPQNKDTSLSDEELKA
ncbi:phage protease [Malaciobacter marinus]|uniref:phage protease n=1 Tax=Malaciobacter marinus TaxID=505249 RepID=UPI003B00725F